MMREEAIKLGCPESLSNKLKKFGIKSFTTPHGEPDWEVIEKRIDVVINMMGQTQQADDYLDLPSVKDDEIEDRFGILDL